MIYQGLQLYEHQGKFYFEDPSLSKNHNGRPGSYEAFLQKYNLKITSVRTPTLNHLYTGRPIWENHTKKALSDMKSKHSWWLDHEKLFYHSKSKGYVLTTQPYNLTLELFQELEQFCQNNHLRCFISYEDAWHYPGKTPLIAICHFDRFNQIF